MLRLEPIFSSEGYTLSDLIQSFVAQLTLYEEFLTGRTYLIFQFQEMLVDEAPSSAEMQNVARRTDDVVKDSFRTNTFRTKDRQIVNRKPSKPEKDSNGQKHRQIRPASLIPNNLNIIQVTRQKVKSS